MRNVLARRWRRCGGAAALLLAAAAFLAWGPIGLGNGPLFMGVQAGQGWADTGRARIAMFIPVTYSGHQPAVIDSVRFSDHTSYPAPAVFALRLVTGYTCGGEWRLRAGPHGLLPDGCRVRGLRPLIGQRVPFSPPDRPRFEAVAETMPPARDSCWAVTSVIVAYHVGIRHYTATGPYATVACTGQAATDANVQRAMNAASHGAPG
jgi:hypothetical protein